MIDKRMRLVDAYNLVRRKRSIAQPNQAFRLQLAKYEVRKTPRVESPSRKSEL